MNCLELFYYEPVEQKYIPVKGDAIPLIKNSSGKALTQILVRNTSDNQTANFIEIQLFLYSASDIVHTAIKPTGEHPSPSDFSTSLTYSHLIHSNILESVLPGNEFTLFVGVSSVSTPATIDLQYFSLDLTYIQSHFPIEHLIQYVEFTETLQYVEDNLEPDGKSYVIQDSMYPSVDPLCIDGIEGEHIIKGTGYAYFNNEDDRIEIDLTGDIIGEFSLFIKAILYAREGRQVFVKMFSANNSEILFGLNEQRKVFVSLKNLDTEPVIITSESSIEDVYGEHVFGLSINNISGDKTAIVITVDGSILKFENIQAVLPEDIDTLYIGDYSPDGFFGAVSSYVLFNKYKKPAFHLLIANNI